MEEVKEGYIRYLADFEVDWVVFAGYKVVVGVVGVVVVVFILLGFNFTTPVSATVIASVSSTFAVADILQIPCGVIPILGFCFGYVLILVAI